MPATPAVVVNPSPSERTSIERRADAARKGAVFFDLTDTLALITLTGPDRVNFLQSLTTNDVAGLETGSGLRTALLNKKAGVVSDFLCFEREDHFLLLLRRQLVKPTLELLEQYHFAEDIAPGTLEKGIIAHQGRSVRECLTARLDNDHGLNDFAPLRAVEAKVAGHTATVISHSLTGEPGFLVLTDPDDTGRIRAQLLDAGAGAPAFEGDAELLDALRIEAGELFHGIDFDESTMLPELSLGDEIANSTKGCYPGQEVVAKVLNRGKSPRRIVGLVAKGEPGWEAGDTLEMDGSAAGNITSAAWSPTLGEHIAIANLRTKYAEEGATLEFAVGDRVVPCRVVKLPFYVSPYFRERAETLYEQGMQQYHADDYQRARESFEAALAVDKAYADAWEALAMTVEKMGDLDAAIVLNRKYAELDPNAIMAHSNLSRLYMLRGFKERAEEEMAKATAIGFRLKARERQADAAARKEAEAQAAEAERAEQQRRMDIFRQVLEMDPEDEIANFGIGKLYLETGNHEKAVEHLRRVIEVNPEYSAAFELLARALNDSGDREQALEVLKRGIDVAGSRGDLMPKKAMEELLHSLKD